MKANLTEMVFILDRSGSMHHLTNDTIGGFNSMIESQKKEDVECFVTTVLFDDKYDLLHDHVNIKNIKPITNNEYYARGMTALFDSVGKTINSVGSRLAATPEDERPSKVIFVIITDGAENASREFRRDAVRSMITHQKEKYSWDFMFLGANIDAEAEAESLGIDRAFSKTYTASSIGTESVYAAVANSISYLSSEKCYADALAMNFDETACCTTAKAEAVRAILDSIE